MSYRNIEAFLAKKTEQYLTWRKRRLLKKKARQKHVHPVIDWTLSILVIIVFVMLINMFLFQNYRIPSESMVPELLRDDLIFVEKVSFGPEILPGAVKLPPLREPKRGEVVSFESDVYAREGPLIELCYRFVYFITLSLVNLKTDESNNVLKDLLIKRVIGTGGDRVRLYENGPEILPAGEGAWLPEKPLLTQTGVSYTLVDRLYDEDKRARFERSPMDSDYCSEWNKAELGWYVPYGTFFPMGDNRPNSRDATVFGPVSLSRIQGKALFRFFPFARFGNIN